MECLGGKLKIDTLIQRVMKENGIEIFFYLKFYLISLSVADIDISGTEFSNTARLLK